MKKREIIIALLGGLVFLISGCTGVRIIHTAQVPEFSLSNYKTYDFYDVEVDVGDNTGFNTRVEWLEEEMIKQFEIRGLKQSDSNPDLLVNIGIALVDMVQTRETDFVTDAPRYAGSMNYGWQSETVEIGSYQEGTVVFHFVDRESLIVIWEGIAQSVIEEKDEKSKKNIAVGVEKLFKNFD